MSILIEAHLVEDGQTVLYEFYEGDELVAIEVELLPVKIEQEAFLYHEFAAAWPARRKVSPPVSRREYPDRHL